MPRKITIFEPHFHDAQFGPTVEKQADESTESDTTTDVTTETDSPSSSGLGFLKYVVVAAVVAIIGGVVYKKLIGEDGLEIEIEELDTEEATASQ